LLFPFPRFHFLSLAYPDKDSPPFISRDALGSNQFILQILKIGLVEVEAALEGTVRDPPLPPQ
jgi:hypothetical protein